MEYLFLVTCTLVVLAIIILVNSATLGYLGFYLLGAALSSSMLMALAWEIRKLGEK